MSEIPQEWVDKAADALWSEGGPKGGAPRHLFTRDARIALAAVLPDVRRAVAEEIAKAIDPYAMEPEQTPGFVMESALFSTMRAYEHAVRIAREAGGS